MVKNIRCEAAWHGTIFVLQTTELTFFEYFMFHISHVFDHMTSIFLHKAINYGVVCLLYMYDVGRSDSIYMLDGISHDLTKHEIISVIPYHSWMNKGEVFVSENVNWCRRYILVYQCKQPGQRVTSSLLSFPTAHSIISISRQEPIFF